MKIKRKKGIPQATIPASSMGDIAFLLIIFFMVSTTISKDKVTVDLPTSFERTEIPKDSTVISIQKSGVIQGNGDPYQHFEVEGFARAILEQKPDAEFVLKVDRDTEFLIVDQVLDQLRKAQVRNICFPTEGEEGSATANP